MWCCKDAELVVPPPEYSLLSSRTAMCGVPGMGEWEGKCLEERRKALLGYGQALVKADGKKRRDEGPSQ